MLSRDVCFASQMEKAQVLYTLTTRLGNTFIKPLNLLLTPYVSSWILHKDQMVVDAIVFFLRQEAVSIVSRKYGDLAEKKKDLSCPYLEII